MSQHPEIIPEGYTPARYFYYLQTGKTGNQCIICKSPTEWNEGTGKYERFCKNPKCKEQYREIFKKRMINRHGKVTLLDDPEQQRKMLEAKKNHGEMRFPADGGYIGYNSTYEQDFLLMLATFLKCNASDIMGPSPHTYYYEYKNPNDKEHEGRKFYIPDYWIPSLNLEIEIKQNTSTHLKILAIDKVKEAQKDEMMKKIPGVRYIKIVDKDYSEFFDLLYSLRETYPDKQEAAMEGFSSLINSRPRDWDKTEMELLTFIDRLGNWTYGFIDNGKPSTDFGEDDINFETKYRSLNPAEFGRYKCGVCFDYAAYIHETLAKKYHLASLCYYVKFGPKYGWDDCPSHSFCVIPGKKFYYLEASMKYAIGLYEFSTISDVVCFIKQASGIKSDEVWCYEYNPTHVYGLSAREYDEKITNECKAIPINLKRNPIYIRKIGGKIANESMSLLSHHISEDNEDLTPCIEFLNTIRTILDTKYSIDRDYAIESAGYSKECHYPIFILLTKGHSPLSGIIMKATGDQFSHSSISFDISLNPMYSFGTKKLGPPREMGFVKTHPKDPAWDQSQPTPYWLYVTYVDKGNAEKMKNRLNYFIENAEKMRYSFGGLPKVFFQLKSRKNQKWFCSAFVAEILGAGKVLKKDSTLYMPRDLKEIDDVEFVISGDDISRYDPQEAKKALEKIKKKEPEDSIAEEGFLRSKDDFKANLELWGTPGHNVLFITGFSGSGKSTTARDIEYKENVYYVELDGVENCCDHSASKALTRAMNKYPEYKTIYDEVQRTKVPHEWTDADEDIIYEMCRKLVNFCKSDQSHRYVIEGLQLYKIYPENFFDHEPIIIKGTSALTSAFRSHKRDMNRTDIASYEKAKGIIHRFKANIKDAQKINSIEDSIAEEGFFDFFKVLNPAAKLSAISSFRDALFDRETNALVGKAPPTTSKYVTASKVLVDNRQGIISIQNINIKLLIKHIRETFGEKRLDYIFDRTYTSWDIRKFKQKRLTRSQMKITSLTTPIFFALELTILFNELYKKYKLKYYASIAVQIYNSSWLSETDQHKKTFPIDLTRLKSFAPDYQLESWQLEFIKLYPQLRAQLGLRGYYLSFDQGLGKTITAAALAEVRGAETVFIVAPNNVCATWEVELDKYFNSKYDSVICGKQVPSDPTKVKYFIVNNESIKAMMPYLKYAKKSMLIVDECHNFRNMGGQRVDELLTLREKLNPADVLLLSGTPIKAIPSEIVPALKLLDPLFTDEAAEIYNACFKFDSYLAMDIVNNRFGKVIYRKTKAELRKEEKLFLPEKYVKDLPLLVPAPEKYFLKNIREEVQAEFIKFYKEMSAHDAEQRERLTHIVENYSTADPEKTSEYLDILIGVTDRNPDAPEGFGMPLHEIDKAFFESFLANYVTNNPKIPGAVILEVQQLERQFIRLKNSAMGKAIGKIYPPRRAMMYNELFKYNRDLIEGMILNADKKVIIFTQFVPTANYLAEELDKDGIKTVIITGSVSNRGAVLEQFKTDPDVKVLVATSQTLGVGVTLIEASHMFFFGPPWRSTDYDQCCDRIYRYGQTVDVYIWNVTLDTPSKNLSDRMESILEWSDTMFHSAIDGETVIANEGLILDKTVYRNKIATLYHGSDRKLNTIDPMGIDLGNMLQSAGWSSFYFDDYSLAYKWATFVTIRNIRKKINSSHYIRGFCTGANTFDLYATGEDLQWWSNYLVENPTTAYVYTVKAPMKDIGYGNDSSKNEFTLRYSVKPDKSESIKITPQMLQRIVIIKSSEELVKLRKQIPRNTRGMISLIFDREFTYQKWNHKDSIDTLYNAVTSGELKPGDDVEKFITDHNLTFSKVPLSARLPKVANECIDFATEACNIKPSKKGFYYKDRWNSIVERAGKKYRERVEVLVFDNDRVYIVETKNNYTLPGGSTEPNKTLEEQAIAEVREECRFNITDLHFENRYFVEYSAEKKKKLARCFSNSSVIYDGECNYVFTARYKSGYAGIVLSKDTSPDMLYGTWVKFKDARKMLKPEHVGLLPAETRTALNIEPATESVFTSTAIEVPGQKEYRFEKSHVLMVITNDPSNELLDRVYEVEAIEQRTDRIAKLVSIIDLDEFITYYLGGRGALKNDRTINEPAIRLNKILQDLRPKPKTRSDIFKMLPLALEKFTKKEPEHAIILNIVPYAYGLLPYDMYRVDYGTLSRVGGAIKTANNNYRMGNIYHHMADPSIKHKGVMLENPEKVELYHVSTVLDLTKLDPHPTRSPMMGEMVVPSRVSAAPTVDKCFKAIYQRKGAKYAIYKLLPTKKTRLFKPNNSAVPDASKTDEVWVLDPVKVKKIDQIILVFIQNRVYTIKDQEWECEVEDENSGEVFQIGIDPSREGVTPFYLFFRMCPIKQPKVIAVTGKLNCETGEITCKVSSEFRSQRANLEKLLRDYICEEFNLNV